MAAAPLPPEATETDGYLALTEDAVEDAYTAAFDDFDPEVSEGYFGFQRHQRAPPLPPGYWEEDPEVEEEELTAAAGPLPPEAPRRSDASAPRTRLWWRHRTEDETLL